jgi:hypothetical protein
MPFLIYFLISSFLMILRPVSGGSLNERWNIDGPQAIWDDVSEEESDSPGAFVLEYHVSDFAKYPKYQIYHKNCKEVHQENAEQDLFASVSLQLLPDEDDRHQKLLLELTPKHAAQHEQEYDHETTSWYNRLFQRENNKPLEFCVRVGLWTGPNPEEGDGEANFRETDVQVHYLEKKRDGGKKLTTIRDVRLQYHSLRKYKLELEEQDEGPGSIQCGGSLLGCGKTYAATVPNEMKRGVDTAVISDNRERKEQNSQ